MKTKTNVITPDDPRHAVISGVSDGLLDLIERSNGELLPREILAAACCAIANVAQVKGCQKEIAAIFKRWEAELSKGTEVSFLVSGTG